MSATESRAISPMAHADFTFGLVSSKACADAFPTKEASQQFADGIRESRISACDWRKPVEWVVQVGPWMYAHGIKPRPAPAASPLSSNEAMTTGGAPAQ